LALTEGKDQTPLRVAKSMLRAAGAGRGGFLEFNPNIYGGEWGKLDEYIA